MPSPAARIGEKMDFNSDKRTAFGALGAMSNNAVPLAATRAISIGQGDTGLTRRSCTEAGSTGKAPRGSEGLLVPQVSLKPSTPASPPPGKSASALEYR